MRSKHVWATARQIARWHAFGLLPRPRQVPLERGRGTQTAYAAGTASQLVALIRSHRVNGRLRTVALDLWLQGFPIATSYIRPQLVEAAHRLDRLPQAVAAISPRERDKAARRSRNLGAIRRRAGAVAMPTVMRMMTELATGTFTGYSIDQTTRRTDPAEPQLMEKVLGLTRARTDRVGEIGPWLPPGDDLGEYLKEFSSHIGAALGTLEERFRLMADAELEALRLEFSVVTKAGRAAAASEQLFGRGASGMTMLADSHKLPVRDRLDLLVLWPVVRLLTGFAEGFSSFASGLANAQLPTDAQIQYLDRLKHEVPEIAEAMDPRRLSRMARTDPELKEVQPEFAALARKHSRTVKRLRRETGID